MDCGLIGLNQELSVLGPHRDSGGAAKQTSVHVCCIHDRSRGLEVALEG